MRSCKRLRVTFSILDSWRVSLRLGVGANPLLQTNIFFRRKEIDFFPIVFFLLSAHMSLHLSIITLNVFSISSSLSSDSLHSALLILLSTSKLEGQLRNLSRGSSEISFSTFGFRLRSLVNSFCRFPISSGVKSAISSDEDGSSCAFWSSKFSLISLLFPNVPIASKPWGQSLNSSRGSCFAWSVHKTRRNHYFKIPKKTINVILLKVLFAEFSSDQVTTILGCQVRTTDAILTFSSA